MWMSSARLVVGVGLLLTTVPLLAHHSFSAEFDIDKPITLTGTLTELQWINPHGWIHMEVVGDDGVLRRPEVAARADPRADEGERRLGAGAGDLERARSARLGERAVGQEGPAPGGDGVAAGAGPGPDPGDE